MPTPEDDLLSALRGEAPGTIIDQLDAVLEQLWTLSAGLDIELPTSGGPAGPVRPAAGPWGLALDQATSRYVGTGRIARSLAERAQLVEVLAAGIGRARGTATPTTPAAPTGRPAPAGWIPLPAAGRSTVTTATDSWQSGAPAFTSDGINFRLPASGGKPAGKAKPIDSNAQRTECYVAGASGLESGRRAFRLAFDLGPGFPVDTQHWQVIAQWKNTGPGSPPLSLEVRDGQLMLQWHTASGAQAGHRSLGKVAPGRHDVVVQIDHSTRREDSPVSAWRDGARVLDAVRVAPSCYPGRSNYLKVGIYRASAIRRPAELLLRGLAIGADLAAVT